MRRLNPREERLVASVRECLADQKTTHITDETIAQVTRLVTSMTKPRGQIEDRVGTVCTTADLVEWMGISRQAINKAIKEARILAVRKGRGAWLYPIWQLTADYQILPGLAHVLGRMHGVLDAVSIAEWFITHHSDLDGQSPAQWLTDGLDVSPVIALAERFVRRSQASGTTPA
ncbi:MAG: hypothetical protein Q4P71_00495 [Actinomycetaceae bacterium]|nr:hypothetical protein [Actinomycetaceae bacterium]